MHWYRKSESVSRFPIFCNVLVFDQSEGPFIDKHLAPEASTPRSVWPRHTGHSLGNRPDVLWQRMPYRVQACNASSKEAAEVQQKLKTS